MTTAKKSRHVQPVSATTPSHQEHVARERAMAERADAIARELTLLKATALRARYATAVGKTTTTKNRDFLIRAILKAESRAPKPNPVAVPSVAAAIPSVPGIPVSDADDLATIALSHGAKISADVPAIRAALDLLRQAIMIVRTQAPAGRRAGVAPVRDASANAALIPSAGATLSAKWKGSTYIVQVLDGGRFGFNGTEYTSLSTIGRVITGHPCNGYVFFGLKHPARASRKAAATATEVLQ